MLQDPKDFPYQLILETTSESLLSSYFEESSDPNRWQWRGEPSPKLKATIETWLESYYAQEPLPPPFPLEYGSPFDQKVWQRLQEIPFGETLSYQEVAESICHPRAARAVGGACGRNLFLLFIPCHRVIASSKKLGGFGGGLMLKRALLALEGKQV